MKFKNYNSIDVKLLAHTPNIKQIIGMAINMTMKKDFNSKIKPSVLKSIIDMGHTSVFEHVNYTFLVTGGSRSYLAQTTRHRMASYTSGSQHYQNYSDYGSVKPNSLDSNQTKIYEKAIETSMKYYNELIKSGVPKYEARQVLPNGMENNLMITMNARSLMNFFKLRLCYRNTDEIQIIANKQYNLVLDTYKDLWSNIGPACYQSGKCDQGKMCCGVKWKPDYKKV